jgi:aspartate ammonia-lyase
VKTGKSIIDIARSRGDLTEEQIKEILDPARMTEPVSPLEVAKEREKIKSRG